MSGRSLHHHCRMILYSLCASNHHDPTRRGRKDSRSASDLRNGDQRVKKRISSIHEACNCIQVVRLLIATRVVLGHFIAVKKGGFRYRML